MKYLTFSKISMFLILLPGLVYAGTRTFEFNYQVSVPATAEEQGPVHLFIPVATSDERQTIKSREITVSPGAKQEIGREKVYGDTFLHVSRQSSTGSPLEVSVKYVVERRDFSADLSRWHGATYTEAEKHKYGLYLAANKRVPIDGPVVGPISRDIAPGEKSLPVIARAIYDYVIDNMEYKKVGTGWGNGDTYWACSEKYGNCTDFHALFISLARTRGIPARFSIGFPVPTDKPEGNISGYHCWVDFYLPEVGWVPIDASEAWKHPENRDMFFGTHPADRIRFSTGRDLVLGKGQVSGPLNYFIYPLVEIGGKQFEEYEKQFSYRELDN